jgi:hypothetical protein
MGMTFTIRPVWRSSSDLINQAVFSTLTRMAGQTPYPATNRLCLFIGSIRQRLSIIVLDGDEYADALEASSAKS